MGVFDKELNINGKAVRSPEQQVWENMKAIEKLKQETGEWWNTQQVLTTSTTSIAISDTNAPATTQYGFLIDIVGNFFKITAGDGTNLLLEFYSVLGTNSEAPIPSGDGITIKYDANIGFSDNYPLIAGDFIEGKGYSYITISGTTYSASELTNYTAGGTSSNSYLARCALYEYYRKLGKGTLSFLSYSASNPILIEPTLVPFTDNEGNERVGWRSVFHTGGSVADSKSGALSFGSITIDIFVGRTNINDASVTTRPNGHIYAKVLVWNPNTSSYEVHPLTYDYAVSSDLSINSGYGYYLQATYKLSSNCILVGIFDIDCDLDIGMNYEEV